MARILTANDYQVGWICALPVELAAALQMLDEEHDEEHHGIRRHKNDHNSYKRGRIGKHNVVMTCLPDGGTGKASAALASDHIALTFKRLDIRLMVGIGGGVPQPRGKDIRLGDVVVSQTKGNDSGVIQYDFGKMEKNGHFKHAGVLNKPPRLLRSAVTILRAQCEGPASKVSDLLLQRVLNARYIHPGVETDLLYDAAYDHPDGGDTSTGEATCKGCDLKRIIQRPARISLGPKVHHGLIASGDQVMRCGRTRDELWQRMRIDCFEMESAGLMEDYPFLAIRGISDYADSHKNDAWQPYAAATAAAYAKELLLNIASTGRGERNRRSEKPDKLPEAPSPELEFEKILPGAFASLGLAEPETPPRQSTPRHSTPRLPSTPQRYTSKTPTPSPQTSFGYDSEAGVTASDLTTSSESNTQEASLRRAAKLGNTSEARRLLTLGVNPSSKLRGSTMLQTAVRYGHTDVVKLLLSFGADTKVTDDRGRSLPGTAARRGHVAVVRVLLEHEGADIESRDKYGSMPLHLSAEYGYKDVVEQLIKYGADVNAQTRHGATALHKSSENGHTSLVEVLLQNGASVDVMDKHGCTALHLSASEGHVRVMEALIRRGAAPNAPDKGRNTPLHKSAANRKLPAINVLLQGGAAMDAANEYGCTALHISASQGYTSVMEALIQRGATVDAKNNYNNTPLHKSAARGQVMAAKALLQKAAAVGATNKAGNTPLHTSALNDRADVTKVLFQYGANVDALNKNGNTSLHESAYKGHVSVMKVLMKKGASLDILNKDRHTPLYAAALGGHAKAVELLIQAGVSLEAKDGYGRTPLHRAVYENQKGVFQILIKHGANVNTQNDKGSTPLHEAAIRGSEDMVSLLLLRRANVRAQDYEGCQPIHKAAGKGHVPIFERLWRHGSAVDAKDKRKQTPAFKAASKGQVQVLDWLLGHKVNIRVEASQFSPLFAAAKYGHLETVRFLLDNGARVTSTAINIARQGGYKFVVALLESRASRSFRGLATRALEKRPARRARPQASR